LASPRLRVVRRESDKAYVSDMLWLPKKKVAETAVKEALQFWAVEKGSPVLQKLWDETNSHIICPREFLAPESYQLYPFPFVDLTPSKFSKTNMWFKGELRGNQIDAYDAFSRARSGVLNLAPGKGKTVLALKKAADIGCPTLIVVHTSYLYEQWRERIAQFLELPYKKQVGRIQGPDFDWHQPIAIAMIHTLSNRVDKGDIPPEFTKHFGMVIFDEVHHLSAPEFVKSAPLIRGLRYGLTATANRLDGMEFIYRYHIGNIFYTDLRQDLIPRVYFQLTPIVIDRDSPEVLDVSGQINIPKLRSHVGRMEAANKFRAHCIREALSTGRKILALSHSKMQLRLLHEMFPNSGLIIQETPQATRTEIVQKSRVCFAIAQLGAEGLDDEDLDTLFVLTPFSSPNDLQQFVGRIQREKEGKRTPVVSIFDDVHIKEFHGLCHKLKRTFREWKMPIEVLHAPKI
jgi:superfamily II DNA or RNA helicase